MLMAEAFPTYFANDFERRLPRINSFIKPTLTVSEWLLRDAQMHRVDIRENKRYIKEKLFEQMQFSATGKEFIEKDDGEGFIKRLEEIYQDTLKCLGLPVESFFEI